MKKLILPTLGLFIINSLLSQEVNSISIQADLNQAAKYNGARQTGNESFQSYSSGIVKGSQFFYPTWTGGYVNTIHDESISAGYTFLYDKVRQQLFMKKMDSSIVMLVDKKQVSSFTLNTDRPHNFVPTGTFGSNESNDFFEVLLLNDKGCSLLRLIKTKFVKADNSNIEKIREGQLNDEFVDEVTYYISMNRALPIPLRLNAKSIKKTFSFAQNKTAAYFDQHRNDKIDELFLIGLVNYINE